jgi:phosphate acyltransferase
MRKQIKIVVDAMGGDNAPQAVVEGAVAACREYRIEIILTGNKDVLKNYLKKFNGSYLPISIKHAADVVTMEDNPLDVVRKKSDSSIRVGLELVEAKKADAFVSAGNSGAVASGALFIIKRIKGIDRPAIAAVMPAFNSQVTVVDAGANNMCKPFNLVQFAIMSSVYSKYFLHCQNPRVGLLSNGEETTKGTDTIRNAHELLRESRLNYIGFIEGKDVFKGSVDVVVCDGFVGNILLKVAEGVAECFGGALKQELAQSFLTKIGYFISRNAFTRLKKRFDYSEYGGAPLLGVTAPVIIAHGRSNAYAIKNAIRAAKEYAEADVVYHISNDLEANKDLHSIGKKPSFFNRLLHPSKTE